MGISRNDSTKSGNYVYHICNSVTITAVAVLL